MSQHFRLQHMPLQVPASSTVVINTSSIGGLFCTGAGTFTISAINDQGAVVTVVSFSGVAGTWYTLPFYLGTNGGQIVSGVGATGVLAA